MKHSEDTQYLMHLFIVGNDSLSVQSRENLVKICETHLKGRYQLQITDISQDFEEATKNRILVIPTLRVEIITASERLKKNLIGSLEDSKVVMEALGLRAFE